MIVPLFGFFNAGVALELDTLRDIGGPVSMGVFLGLFLGKQVGVIAATWAAVRMNIGLLPSGVGFLHIYGAGLLAGVGFTMGLFVTALAFEAPAMAASARLAILAGSSLSAVTGLIVLWCAQRPRNRAPRRRVPREFKKTSVQKIKNGLTYVINIPTLL